MVNLYKTTVKMHSENSIGAYISYGITGRSANGETVAIDDVTPSKAKAEAICEALNGGNVSTAHFKDVIEDMI